VWNFFIFLHRRFFFLFTLISITFERVVLQRLRYIHIVSMGQDHLFLEFEKNLSNQFRGLDEFDQKHHTFELFFLFVYHLSLFGLYHSTGPSRMLRLPAQATGRQVLVNKL
jgi:hypothetical protein